MININCDDITNASWIEISTKIHLKWFMIEANPFLRRNVISQAKQAAADCPNVHIQWWWLMMMQPSILRLMDYHIHPIIWRDVIVLINDRQINNGTTDAALLLKKNSLWLADDWDNSNDESNHSVTTTWLVFFIFFFWKKKEVLWFVLCYHFLKVG